MGCPASCHLGDNLVFSVCTHDPTTGVLTDADSVPSYRIYEDETGTAILTGVMAKLDDTNTTGFYTETIAVTTANLFDVDKTYTIYITATVAGDTGGISFAFKVDDWIKKAAVIAAGDVSNAGEAVENFTLNGASAAVTVDVDGNRTIAWS